MVKGWWTTDALRTCRYAHWPGLNLKPGARKCRKVWVPSESEEISQESTVALKDFLALRTFCQRCAALAASITTAMARTLAVRYTRAWSSTCTTESR